MSNEPATIYMPPDIRKQTLEQAEKRLEQARANRMVTLFSYKQKLEAKLTNTRGVEATRFAKRKETFLRAMQRAEDAIDTANLRLKQLTETDWKLRNIEDEIDKL